jgi:hypothetical protein
MLKLFFRKFFYSNPESRKGTFSLKRDVAPEEGRCPSGALRPPGLYVLESYNLMPLTFKDSRTVKER